MFLSQKFPGGIGDVGRIHLISAGEIGDRTAFTEAIRNSDAAQLDSDSRVSHRVGHRVPNPPVTIWFSAVITLPTRPINSNTATASNGLESAHVQHRCLNSLLFQFSRRLEARGRSSSQR